MKKKSLMILMSLILLVTPVLVSAGELNINEDVGLHTDLSEDLINPEKARFKSELLTAIEIQMNERRDEVRIRYYGDEFNNVQEVIDIMNELNDSYGVANKAGYGVYPPRIQDGYKLIRIVPNYNTTQEQEEYLSNEVSRIIDLIIKPEMTEFEQVRAIHNYLVDNVSYSSDTIGSEYSAYTVFHEGKGVCNGYALAYSRLLDEVNIPNLYVKGPAETSPGEYVLHAWNKVMIDGEWYNSDVTWASPRSRWGLKHGYKYFLKSDEFFYKDHEAIFEDKLPKSTNNQYDIIEFDNTFL